MILVLLLSGGREAHYLNSGWVRVRAPHRRVALLHLSCPESDHAAQICSPCFAHDVSICRVRTERSVLGYPPLRRFALVGRSIGSKSALNRKPPVRQPGAPDVAAAVATAGLRRRRLRGGGVAAAAVAAAAAVCGGRGVAGGVGRHYPHPPALFEYLYGYSRIQSKCSTHTHGSQQKQKCVLTYPFFALCAFL